MQRTLSTKEIKNTGLLHTVNEKVLWPLGLALVLNTKTGLMSVTAIDDTIETGLDPKAHEAMHRAWEKFERERLQAVSPPAAGGSPPKR